jgi:hypothetical protein
MKRPFGSEVSLTYTSGEQPDPGDALVTQTGRAYIVLSIQIPKTRRGSETTSRIKAIVVEANTLAQNVKQLPIVWTPRSKKRHLPPRRTL